MKKKRFHYSISGYRWAPESFRAAKGLIGQPAKNIPLTNEQRHEVGLLSLTKGPDVAIGYVKHIERARERQRRKSSPTFRFLRNRRGNSCTVHSFISALTPLLANVSAYSKKFAPVYARMMDAL